MKLEIRREIFEQNPDLKVGAILIKNVNNSRRVSAVEGLLRGIRAQKGREFKGKDIFEDRMVGVWCGAFGKFGANPKRHLPSLATLLRQAKSGKDIPHENVMTDLCKYFSLKHMLPVRGEDMDWLCGDLILGFTKGGEPFRPKNSIDVKKVKEGEAAYFDEGGITCRFWNNSECERTKLTPKTVNILLLVEDLSRMHMDEFGSILKDIQSTIIKYVGGEVENHILNEENNSLELGIQGRGKVDDSKIPQQEKAHYISKKTNQGEYEKRLEPEWEPEPDPKPGLKPEPESKSEPEPEPKPESEDSSKKTTEEDPFTKKKTPDSRNFSKEMLKDLLIEAIKEAYPEIPETDPHIEYPAQEENGDYASNIALHLSKELGAPPREIAEKIVENFKDTDFIEKTEVAGPGFINFFISKKTLDAEVKKVLEEEEDYGKTKIGEGQTVVLDYSAPNIAKPLGVHHLLSTIIGQSVCNLFKETGFKTVSINHIGDWGTQFGKLIFAYKKWGEEKMIKKSPIDELLKLYVKFHEEAEQNPEIEDEARSEFKKFEEGDEENKKLWKWFVEESMKEIKKTYERLGGIHFDYTQGESFYQNKIEGILEEGKKKGVFVEGEEGAFVIEYEDENIPTVPIQKKDGTTLYMTREFATLKYRIENWDPYKILYVVDVAQTLHFKQLFLGAERLGWYDGQGEHVSFGRMHMKDGGMSTRKGNVVLLEEVLDEAVKRAAEIIEEKNPNIGNKKEVAEKVGIGAVKYNILSQNRLTDITFDWDRMLSLEGNSAPYLQYTYARARSILRKAGSNGEDDIEIPEVPEVKDLPLEPSSIKDPENVEEKIKEVMRVFPKYIEQIEMAAKERKPNILANYIYDLAQKFNSFYNTVPVIKADSEEKKKQRIEIVTASAQIIRNGLALLGVDVVEEM